MTAQEPEAGEREQYRGVIIIEWPPPVGTGPYSAIPGPSVTITDAVTGKMITTCSHADIVIHADVAEIVTAELTLFADADGNPVLSGPSVAGDGEILTGTFTFAVSEMRVRQA